MRLLHILAWAHVQTDSRQRNPAVATIVTLFQRITGTNPSPFVPFLVDSFVLLRRIQYYTKILFKLFRQLFNSDGVSRPSLSTRRIRILFHLLYVKGKTATASLSGHIFGLAGDPLGFAPLYTYALHAAARTRSWSCMHTQSAYGGLNSDGLRPHPTVPPAGGEKNGETHFACSPPLSR